MFFFFFLFFFFLSFYSFTYTPCVLSESGRFSGVVLILNTEHTKYPKISTKFSQTFDFMQLFLIILSGMTMILERGF